MECFKNELVAVPEEVAKWIKRRKCSMAISDEEILTLGMAELFDKKPMNESKFMVNWLKKGHLKDFFGAVLNGCNVVGYEIPLIGLETSNGDQQYLCYDKNKGNFFASKKLYYENVLYKYTKEFLEDKCPQNYLDFAKEVVLKKYDWTCLDGKREF